MSQKVTIVIPTYNSSNHIVTAIDSIQNQVYNNIEIIIVDDGSTDDTKKILKNLINDKSIRYVYQENKGASAARNKGISLADSQYIGFLDSDDKFEPLMISRCMDELTNNDYDLVSVDNYMIYLSENKEIRRDPYEYEWIEKEPNELFLTFLKVGGIGGIHKAVFKKTVFEKVGYLDENLAVYEDLDLWMRISMNSLKWHHIREKLVLCYRSGANDSLFTKNAEINQDCRIRVLRKYKAEAIRRSPDMKKVLSEQLWDYGRNYITEFNNIPKALHCLVSSFILQPNISQTFKSIYNFLR